MFHIPHQSGIIDTESLHTAFMHLDMMRFFKVFLQGSSKIDKVSLILTSEVLVAVVAVGQMRIVSQSYVNPVHFVQMLGDFPVAAQMTVAVFTVSHGEEASY
jgi:hypothetical protein